MLQNLLNLCIIVIVCVKYCSTEGLNCSFSKFEDDLVPIVGHFGIRNFKNPENRAEMVMLCRKQTKADKLAKEYARQCLKGLAQTMMSVTVYAANRINKQLCGKQMNGTIESGPCINGAKKDTVKCWNSLTDNLYRVNAANDYKIKIPLFCCNFHLWKDCTMDSIRAIGSPLCSEKIQETIDHRISRGSIDPLNVLCSDYSDESDKCSNLLKQMPTNTTRTGTRPKTPFLPLIQLFDTI